MAPRRPPPLPASLFASQGPLAPGSAKLAPSPSSLHPQMVIDASKPGSTPNLSTPAQATFGVDKLSTEPIAKVTDIFIDPLKTSMQSEKDWDQLEAQLDVMSTLTNGMAFLSTEENVNVQQVHRIVLAGLLPPFVDASISPSQLVQSRNHDVLWTARIASLSLKENMYLKVLPPIVCLQADSEGGKEWWEERSQIKECVRIYLAHALECFGAHRLMFGTTPTSNTPLSGAYVQPISDADWPSLLREVLAELVANEASHSAGPDSSPAQQCMDDVFGRVAMVVYAA